jgi:hypothetical protein
VCVSPLARSHNGPFVPHAADVVGDTSELAPASSLPPSSGGTVLVSGQLPTLSFPCPLVCIAQGWPSQVVLLLALKLPVKAAFFPKHFHATFTSMQPGVEFHELHEVPTCLPSDAIYLLSGSSSFVTRHLSIPQLRNWSLVHVEMKFQDYPGNHQHKHCMYLMNSVWGPAGLTAAFLEHYSFGGATDARYIVGIGSLADPHSRVRHGPQPPLRRSLRHFWSPSESSWDLEVCDPLFVT